MGDGNNPMSIGAEAALIGISEPLPVRHRGRAAWLLAATAAAGFLTAPKDQAPPVYLLVSHRHLHRQAALAGALRRTGAMFVPPIHDVIPLDFPEFGQPGEAARHRRRPATVARLADGVVVNLAETGAVCRGIWRGSCRSASHCWARRCQPAA